MICFDEQRLLDWGLWNRRIHRRRLRRFEELKAPRVILDNERVLVERYEVYVDALVCRKLFRAIFGRKR